MTTTTRRRRGGEISSGRTPEKSTELFFFLPRIFFRVCVCVCVCVCSSPAKADTKHHHGTRTPSERHKPAALLRFLRNTVRMHIHTQRTHAAPPPPHSSNPPSRQQGKGGTSQATSFPPFPRYLPPAAEARAPPQRSTPSTTMAPGIISSGISFCVCVCVCVCLYVYKHE